MKCTIIIKDCKDGEKLWSEIKGYVQSVIDGMPDGTVMVKYSGVCENGLYVIEKCLAYGVCEITASFK